MIQVYKNNLQQNRNYNSVIMIQIVKTVYVKQIGDKHTVWSAIPIIPATAEIKIEKKMEDAGWVKIVKFRAICTREHIWLFKKLMVKIMFDDGPVLEIGNADIPVVFTVSKQNTQEVTFEHKSRFDE